MDGFTLFHDVHTLEGRLLLSAGTMLSEDTMAEVVSRRGESACQDHSFIRHRNIKDDLLVFLSHQPYNVICSGPEETAALLEQMETISLVEPVLQSMDYFRDNDLQTYRHVLMVFALSTILAMDLLSDRAEKVTLAETGPSHDIGKVCVPLEILKKTTPLTRRERGILRNHTAAGYVMLSYYMGASGVLSSRVARDHHERNNGSGYPRGIMLRDPMVEIVAASDVYDALISPRPYRPVSYDNRTALEEITAMAERDEIGWDVVKVLVARNRSTRGHFTESDVSREKRGKPPEDNLHGITLEEEEDA